MGLTIYHHIPKCCGIYRLSFPDGSFYIGQTRNLRKRYISYMSNARTGYGNPKLNEKISEYGEPTVELLKEFLEEDYVTTQELRQAELDFIKKFKPTLNNAFY